MKIIRAVLTALALACVTAWTVAVAVAAPPLFRLTDHHGTVHMTVRDLSPNTNYTEAFQYKDNSTDQTCTGTFSGYQTDDNGTFSLSLPIDAYHQCPITVTPGDEIDLYVWLGDEGSPYFSSVTLPDGSHATGELSFQAS